MEVTLTLDNFDTEVLNSPIPVLVDFWAPWCGPCRMLAPTIEKIAKDYEGKVKVGKVNTDENSYLASQYGITGIPTVLVFQNGEPVKSSIGYVPESQLKAMLDE